MKVSALGVPPLNCVQIDHLEELFYSRSIIGRKCTFHLTQLRPASASLSSLENGLPVYPSIQSFSGLEFIFKLPWYQPLSPPLCSQVNSLQVDLWVPLISGSKCISKCTQSKSPKCITMFTGWQSSGTACNAIQVPVATGPDNCVQMGAYIDT